MMDPERQRRIRISFALHFVLAVGVFLAFYWSVTSK